VYVFEIGYVDQLIFKIIPYCLISSPISAHIFFACANTPFDFLSSNFAAGLGIAHFTGQVAVISQVNVNIHRRRGGETIAIKVVFSGTLIEAGLKCLFKNYAFLI
jgi:hypothetical protein